MKMRRMVGFVRFLLVGLIALSILLFINACGVDDGLGKLGETEEEFFTVIEAPLDLTVMSATTSSVTLAWTDMSADEEGFAIFRREDSVPDFTPAAVVSADVTAYVDLSVSDDTTYHYYVRALRGPFISDASDVATGATPPIPATVPADPTNFIPVVLSNSSIILTWTDVADETSYTIEYSNETDNPGVWTPTVLSPNIIAYVFNGLSGSKDYAFRIKATNGVGDSGYATSVPATATTFADPIDPPGAPSNMTAQTIPYLDVVLNWDDNSSLEEEYVISRDGAEIARIAADSTSYTDYNITPGTYNYSVYASNLAGQSAAVTVTGIVMPTAPAAPSALSVVPHPFLRDNYSLGWKDNSSNEEGFRIYVYPVACILIGRTTKATLLSTEPANDTSYVFSSRDIPVATAVCVYVQSFNDGGTGSSTKYSYTFK